MIYSALFTVVSIWASSIRKKDFRLKSVRIAEAKHWNQHLRIALALVVNIFIVDAITVVIVAIQSVCDSFIAINGTKIFL